MEGGRKQSGHSLATTLFGAKDSPQKTPIASSSSISAIFDTPSKVSYMESLRLREGERNKNGSENQAWSGKIVEFGNDVENGQEQSQSKESGVYYQQQPMPPCHYSSSIYYGGPDVFSQPKSVLNPRFNKEGEDVRNDSMGNWWEGSYNY